MKPIKSINLLLCGILLLLLMAGCGPKAAGTWTAPDAGNGAGTLTLNKDGTGQMNMPPSTGPIKWSEDGNTVKIFQSTDDPATATPLMTGTLSDDKKSLNLAIGGGEGLSVSITLTRQ
jgi:hypothetical protein